MKFHPLADLFPMMADAEIGELAADIFNHGLQESITTHDDMILDGRNRLVACNKVKVTPKFVKWQPLNGETPLQFVLAKNLHRRHLTTSQRAMVATRLSALSQGEKRADAQICALQNEAAEALNVSRRSVQEARKVVEKAAPEVAAAVSDGTVSVSDAAAVADAPKAEQRKALKNVEAGKAKTLKQQIKPKHCDRCLRIGKPVKDCQQCAELRESNKPTRQKKPGKVLFDDRSITELIRKFVQAIDARAKVHGKTAGFKDIEAKLEAVSHSWNRWKLELK